MALDMPQWLSFVSKLRVGFPTLFKMNIYNLFIRGELYGIKKKARLFRCI